MVKIKVPKDLCMEVSQKAVRYSRQEMSRRRWSSRTISSLKPTAQDGVIGISTPLKYIFYQERGIRPFLMTSLEGKRIPIDGRVVTAKGVGTPGFVRVPRRGGGPDKVVWRNQKWKHPGIKPQGILKAGLSRAILEERPRVNREILRRLRGE